MEDLGGLAQAIDVGGNVALLIAVYYINQSAKFSRTVAERLARIEANLDIDPQPEPKE